ncbi:hypothetical protein MAR_008179 [Mya arenaria]|uniref:Uncharacterized protein n=1 Tax=Mya arenaria TaxID=6604 RepID=A0ABY7DZD0_MYAAR|nr:hypothetical protein MAR_008179 [Mya arenaria]
MYLAGTLTPPTFINFKPEEGARAKEQCVFVRMNVLPWERMRSTWNQ